jgi:hypothetical protein
MQIPAILPLYHRSLALHLELVGKFRSHSITFEEAINQWAQQAWLEEEGWNSAWEDLCRKMVAKENKSNGDYTNNYFGVWSAYITTDKYFM